MFCSFKYHFLFSFNSSSKTTPRAPAFTSTPADRANSRPPQGRGRRSRPRGAVYLIGQQRTDTERGHTTINIPGCGGSASVKRLHLGTATRGSEGADGGLPEGAQFSRQPPSTRGERPPRSPQDGRKSEGESEAACGEARGGHARLSGLQDDEGAGRRS